MKEYIEMEMDIYMLDLQDVITASTDGGTSTSDPDELPPVTFG